MKRNEIPTFDFQEFYLFDYLNDDFFHQSVERTGQEIEEAIHSQYLTVATDGSAAGNWILFR